MRTLATLLIPVLLTMPAFTARAQEAPVVPLEQTVVKQRLAEGVSMDDAVASMKLRANLLNMQLVGELPLYKQLEAMGRESRRMEVFQFCDPITAQQMVEANMDFAAYLPCRIALVEDEQGRGWLVMMDLDMILQGAELDPDLEAKAEQVRDALHEIMDAGAQGAL
jgi:uncharacterized protein (DUF302 family)